MPWALPMKSWKTGRGSGRPFWIPWILFNGLLSPLLGQAAALLELAMVVKVVRQKGHFSKKAPTGERKGT